MTGENPDQDILLLEASAMTLWEWSMNFERECHDGLLSVNRDPLCFPTDHTIYILVCDPYNLPCTNGVVLLLVSETVFGVGPCNKNLVGVGPCNNKLFIWLLLG